MTRSFDPTPLDQGLVADLLDLARRAPSAGYSQGVHFLALTGDAVPAFWRITGGADWFDAGITAAPVLVLPLADPDAYTSRYSEGDKAGHGLEVAANWEVPFWITDAAMAAQNLLLLAEERGLGALYFGIFRNARLALDEFGVPPHVLRRHDLVEGGAERDGEARAVVVPVDLVGLRHHQGSPPAARRGAPPALVTLRLGRGSHCLASVRSARPY